MKALFIASQDPKTRIWAPIGKLTRTDEGYRFAYTKGIVDFPNFALLGRMSDVTVPYFSKELFPIFANRVLPKSRPEHAEYLSWLGLSPSAHDELDELSRTGGIRATDHFELIPCPCETQQGMFEEFFFCRGLSHLPIATQERTSQLEVGERLLVLRDVQNDWDAQALALRTEEPVSVLGYVPAYFTKDFSELMGAGGARSLEVTVEKVNPNAPLQYRLLCRVRAPWPTGFSPCADERFQELPGSSISASVAKSI
jgi:hypothetical protein